MPPLPHKASSHLCTLAWDRGPASRHTFSQLTAKSPVPGGLTSIHRADGEEIPHLSSGHHRLPIRPPSWLTRQRHKTILQRMLCKGMGQALPINALCTASSNLPLCRKLRMAAQLSLPHYQVTWLPLQGQLPPAHTSTLQPQGSSGAPMSHPTFGRWENSQTQL